MRERVGHGGVGRRVEREGRKRFPGGRSGDRPPGGEAAQERGSVLRGAGAWRTWRRPARGPRPVRPRVVSAVVRPSEVPRPAPGPAVRPPVGERWGAAAGLRLLVRRSRPARYRRRRAVAGVAVVVASATAVVALGLLAGGAGQAAVSPVPVSAVVYAPAPGVVTAERGETVWEVVDRVAPGLSGSERAALAERIVIENALTTARLHPGQVLRVAAG